MISELGFQFEPLLSSSYLNLDSKLGFQILIQLQISILIQDSHSNKWSESSLEIKFEWQLGNEVSKLKSKKCLGYKLQTGIWIQ